MLGDFLWKAASQIEQYKKWDDYEDWSDELENVLCEMIALALDVDSPEEMTNNEFHKAVRNKDYQKYLRLSQQHAAEFSELNATLKGGAVETWQFKVAKYYGKT